jgi:transcriptional regulator with XRE-family HTH domain
LAKKKRTVRISHAEAKLLQAFGRRVREMREERRRSVYDITGKDMPIRSRQHWQRIENGQKNINLATIQRVARSLGTSIEELFRGIA